MFPSMTLSWKPCFQVWPFYGNHVSKYDPFMEPMFSSMALLWKPCFLKYGHSMDAMFSKYGFLMEIMFFEVWHFDETCSSVTILTKYRFSKYGYFMECMFLKYVFEVLKMKTRKKSPC